jgi:putative flippase GtrA
LSLVAVSYATMPQKMFAIFRFEKARFVAAGCVNTVLDLSLLNLFVFGLHITPLIANVLSVTAGITCSYFLNHYFVFRSQVPHSASKVLRFFLITGFGLLVIQTVVLGLFSVLYGVVYGRGVFILGIFHDNQYLQLNIAKVVAVGVGMFWNYMFYRYFIFKKPGKEVVTSI